METDVIIQGRGFELQGTLVMPAGPRGLVIVAHGSGSSRYSPRNRLIASGLADARFAVLLMDLLTTEEEDERTNVFDISRLADRIVLASEWVHGRDDLRDLPLGLLGASTGAAAALVAAARMPSVVKAVVSRGGRPDLAGHALALVEAPTLLLVGARDPLVLKLNEDAAPHLNCVKATVVIPGAGHLFEEAGTLDLVIEDSVRWFDAYLTAEQPVRSR